MKRLLSEIRVSDIGDILTGNTPSKKNKNYFEGKYPWIKPTDIVIGNRYVESTEETYSSLAFKKYEKYLLPPGSTCVVTIGTVGEKICLAKEPSFTNQSINAIIPNEYRFDPMFVYYLMKYNLPKIAKRNPGTASGRHHVSKSNFMSMKVSVPTLIIQKMISVILASYDDLIEINQKRIKLLENSARQIYSEWFVKFKFPEYKYTEIIETEYGPIPKEWIWKKLVEIADINASTITPKNAPKKIHYIDISSVNEGQISEISELLFKDAPGRARRTVKNGDIIWSTVRPNLKSFALILSPKKNTIVSTGFAVISGKNVPHSYLYCAITTDTFTQYLTNRTRGAAYPAVNVIDFKNALILYPSPKILEKFDEYTSPLLFLIHTLKEENFILKQTRDLLIPKLISGEINVRDLGIDIGG